MSGLRDLTSLFAAHRLGVWTVAALVCLLVSPHWCPSATWVLCIAVGSLSLAWLCRRLTEDPMLGRIVLASYGVRVLVTLFLFAVSAWRLPVLQGLQRGDGFLQIGGDGVGYHIFAMRIAEAWRIGIDLPFLFRMDDPQNGLYVSLAVPVAFVYRMLGPSLVYALLLTAWVGALAAIPAYLTAATMADRRRARVAAGLVAFWPSFIIWSSQLLKDSFASLAILTTFSCFAVLWRSVPGASTARRRLTTALCWAGLVGAVAMLAYFRDYMGYLLFGAMVLVMIPVCAYQLWMRRYLRVVKAALVIAAVSAAVVMTRATDPLVLFSPRHPEPALIRQGLARQQAGDLDNALRYYLWALQLQPDNESALELLNAAAKEASERLETVGPYTLANFERTVTMLVSSKHFSSSQLAELYIHLGEFYGQFSTPTNQVGAYLAAWRADPSGRDAIERLYGMVKAELARRRDGPGVLSDSILDAVRLALTESKNAERPLSDASTGHGGGPTPIASHPPVPPVAPDHRTWVERLNHCRLGMVSTGGHSMIDAHVTFSSVWDVVAYLPRAWALAFLSPFPTQWFNTSGETGIFRFLAGFEMLLLYLLLIPMLRAGWSLLRHHGAEGWTIVLFSAMTATLLPYVVVNLGILFRFRLQYVLPLLVAVGIADTLRPSGEPQAWAWFRRRLRPSRAGGQAVAGRVVVWCLVLGALAGLLAYRRS